MLDNGIFFTLFYFIFTFDCNLLIFNGLVCGGRAFELSDNKRVLGEQLL